LVVPQLLETSAWTRMTAAPLFPGVKTKPIRMQPLPGMSLQGQGLVWRRRQPR
jgi:hypothetical protein